MQHHFDADIAMQYGMLEAVIINHLEYWIEHNEKNEKNFYDGRYWTFNSMRAFTEVFPYASEKQIRNAIKHLEDTGILIVGNYNKSQYDRTKWYTFSDFGKSILLKGQMDTAKRANGSDQEGPMEMSKKENGSDQEGKMEVPEKANPNCQKGEPIPDNIPDNTIAQNSVCAKEQKFNQTEAFEQFYQAYPRKKSKDAARRRWDKLKVTPALFAEIMQGLERAKKQKEWQDIQFIQYPATWLNSGGWKDEPDAPQQPQPPASEQKQNTQSVSDELARRRKMAGVDL